MRCFLSPFPIGQCNVSSLSAPPVGSVISCIVACRGSLDVSCVAVGQSVSFPIGQYAVSSVSV